MILIEMKSFLNLDGKEILIERKTYRFSFNKTKLLLE